MQQSTELYLTQYEISHLSSQHYVSILCKKETGSLTILCQFPLESLVLQKGTHMTEELCTYFESPNYWLLNKVRLYVLFLQNGIT